MAAVEAPVQVVHGYTVEAGDLRDFAKELWHLPEAKLAECPACRRGGCDDAGGRPCAGPGIEATRSPSASSSRRSACAKAGFTRNCLRRSAISIPSSKARGSSGSRMPACRSSRRRWPAGRSTSSPAKRRRNAAFASPPARSRTSPGATIPTSARGKLPARPAVPLHRHRPCRARLSRGRHARPPCRQPDDPCLSPAIGLLSPSARRRALILGRALLLGYRVSGSVPELLACARLTIDPGRVRLEVGKAARVPDSEVVTGRLKLLAAAMGIRHVEVAEHAS